MPHPPLLRGLRSLPLLVASAGLLTAYVPALADTVTSLNDDGSLGIPYADVQIQGFRDGNVVFVLPNGTETTQSLATVGALSVDAVPLLDEIRADLEAGNDRDAVAKLRSVLSNSGGRAWLETHAKRLMVPPLDRLGDGGQAVPLYLDLVEAGLPVGYLPPPPVQSAATLPASDRAGLAARARRAAEATPAAAASVNQLVTILGGSAAPTASPPGGVGGPATSAAPPGAEPVASADSGTPLPPLPQGPSARLSADGPVLPFIMVNNAAVAQLQAGNPSAALASINEQLNQPGNGGVKYYIRGLIRLETAGEDRDALLDAGLDLMRDVALDSTNNTAALIEVARVHQRLADLATEPADSQRLRSIATAALDRAATLLEGEDGRSRDLLSQRLDQVRSAGS